MTPDLTYGIGAANWSASQELRRREKMPFRRPPSNLNFNLGISHQCWHMAHAACDALGLEFDEASPSEIFEMIDNLRIGQARNNIRVAHEAAIYGKDIEVDHTTGIFSLVERTPSQTVETAP